MTIIAVNNGTKTKLITCETQADLFKNIQEANDADLLYTVYEATPVLTNIKTEVKS